MSTWYRPEKVVVCTRLAGDHQSGVLLYVIMKRYPYAKATLQGTEGTWSANQRTVWFQAAALSRTQGDRFLARLEQHNPALIERAHGAWAGKPHVLFVRPTGTARSVWDAATTFAALDELLKGDESGPLHQLWQAWPGIDAKKAGGIAEWYELLDNRKLTKENLKPHAQYLLQRVLKSDPTIVDIGDTDLLWQRLWEVSQSLAVEDAA